MIKRRAVFLDRDGVINANRSDHVKNWEEFQFLPGVLDALRLLAHTGFPSVVVTNQAAIHRQLTTEEHVQQIHARMRGEIERTGGCIDAIYFCPHTPEENCTCRKPQPGMYLRAEKELNLDLSRSYVIGDSRVDVTAARAIGAQPLLVLSGRDCDRRELGCDDCPTRCIIVQDLQEAVEWIRRKEGLVR